MRTISLTSANFQNVVEITAQTLQKGGAVIAPTDTVYGLLADATNENAVKKIYAIKNRPAKKPLPIFVKNMAMAKKLAKISPEQQFFLETKWPGKFTAILRKNPNIKIYGAGKDTIASRVPFDRFINSLLETFNAPIIGTSANISGQPASTKIDEILSQFAGKSILPDLVINAGDLPESAPSVIADITEKEPKIIRA